jgi:surfeit locus 1 family protein
VTRILIPLIFGLAGAAILVGLGVWQVQRLAWKEGVLAQIGARIGDAPVALPAAPDPARDRYLPVRASGTITTDEAHVLVSVKRVGPGYRIVSVFDTDGGRRILLDRGFVPDAERDTPRPAVRATVEGNLHWPDDRTSSTPENDVSGNIWFARDIDRMAQVLDTEPVLMIARNTSEPDPAVTPLPVDTSGIPNDHLQYAVTWFLLAAVWLAMTGYFLWRTTRRTLTKA